MEFSHLKQFIAVAETQNMSKAAESLFLSQPNLSRTIANLEMELGFKLFERSKGRLILNQNGEKVYAIALNIIDEVDRIKHIAFQNKENTTIAIGGPGSRYFDFIIPYLYKQLPNIEISTSTIFNHEDLRVKMLNGDLDIIIGNKKTVPTNDESSECQYLFTENLCISCSKTHKFANYSSVPIEELNDEHFIRSLNEESKLSNSFFDKYHISGITDFRTDQPINGTKFIHNNALVFDSILCKYFCRANDDRVYIPVDNDDLRYDVYLFYKKENTEKVATVVNLMTDFFKIFKQA